MATTNFEEETERENGLETKLIVATDHVEGSPGWTWTVESHAADMTRLYCWL